MSMIGWVDISCSITDIGKMADRSSGPAGSRVFGFRGGPISKGRSGKMLYQYVGICSSSRLYLTLSVGSGWFFI